jgi:hypothetical protein
MNHTLRQLFTPLALICFALSPAAQAVKPPPDGDYSGRNTAEGKDALFSLTTGTDNTAVGFDALYSNTDGLENTASGSYSLFSNTIGDWNTAYGAYALYHNTIGYINTAVGRDALYANISGYANTAVGAAALNNNTVGVYNTGCGNQALYSNTSGSYNIAMGLNALGANTIGNNNTATGSAALSFNTSGNDNTADGWQAGYANSSGANNTALGSSALAFNSTGSNNIAIGYNAGSQITATSYNIDIANSGEVTDVGVIRIGTRGTQAKTFIAGIYAAVATSGVPVYISSAGQLGTTVSSARFKQNIRDMAEASDVLLSLRPVAFRYKQEIDPERLAQFGLVAEEVEKVAPDLVVRDEDGKPHTVRYDAVNAMLLNEFLKEHRKVEEQGKTIAELRSTIARQEKGMEALSAQMKEQGMQIQRVSAELAASTAPQLVNNR